jgi:galactokinase
VTENARVLAAAEALRRREVTALGPLLRASHASLRDDFSVSCSELDTLAAAADEHPGVIGARMMGGGFGGCVLVLLEAAALPDLEAHLLQSYSERFHRAPEYYRVRSADGALAGRG